MSNYLVEARAPADFIPVIADSRAGIQRRLRRMVPVVVAAVVMSTAFAGLAGSAGADYPTPTRVGSYSSAPNLYFHKGSNDRSTFTAFISVGGVRYRTRVRAGSGASPDECATNRGWLPSGTYSGVRMYNKRGGVPTVRGNVWRLPDKTCRSGRVIRTELFIHTQHGEYPWEERFYKSQGCIKLHHYSRDFLAFWYAQAHAKDNGRLHVRG